ncbi:MAG: cell wall hydrolase [Bacillota bacterium]
MKKIIIFLSVVLISFIFILPVRADNPQFVLIYVIQEGEALYDIASDYEISLEELFVANDFDDENYSIRPGDEIIIPGQNDPQKKSREDAPSVEDWDFSFYSEDEKKEDFNLETGERYAVRVNDEQILPEVDIPEDEIIQYHVKSGDSLYELARSFNTSTGEIMALNEMEDSVINPGETIKMPVNNLSSHQVLSRTISDSELELLARVIYGEARGEPQLGQIAVGAVIINRVLSPYFPDSLKEVIHQSGQFSAVSDGQIDLTPGKEAYTAAEKALDGQDPTQGALYYYNPETATNGRWFEENRDTVITIGDHDFAK